MSEITLKVLAEKLNLSTATISKALRDSHEISKETKAKVLTLARKLNYTPNPYASSLRRKKSNTIAVVIPEVADSFFSLALKGIESVAESKNYHVLVYLTYESFYRERSIMQDFTSGRVDGVLISVSSETSNSQHINALIKKNIPIIFFDRVLETKSAKVTTNDFESSYKATLHLLEKGCRNIAYLSVSKYLTISNNRKDGYLQALKDNKIKDANIVQCSNSLKYNLSLLQKVMQQKQPPDGMIASVEKLTLPIYQVCKNLKISIGQQIKVISFSNLETASILQPALTTITQPAFEMGIAAATLLFKSLGKKNYEPQEENIVIPASLIIRESTG